MIRKLYKPQSNQLTLSCNSAIMSPVKARKYQTFNPKHLQYVKFKYRKVLNTSTHMAEVHFELIINALISVNAVDICALTLQFWLIKIKTYISVD